MIEQPRYARPMPEPRDGVFPTTHWTLVARLKSGDAEIARRALEDLCAQYYYPLYFYIRRRGLDPDDAQDALHNFLAKLLRLGALAEADAEKGRLRALLSTALQRFLLNWRRDQAHREHEFSLDDAPLGAEAEARYQYEGFADHDTPERLFDRKWGYELMTRVVRLLRESYAAKRKSALFDAVQPALLAGGSLRGHDAPRLAASLALSEGALRVAFNRLLGEFRALLEEEVFQTVSSREEVADEIDYLMRLFQRS